MCAQSTVLSGVVLCVADAELMSEGCGTYGGTLR